MRYALAVVAMLATAGLLAAPASSQDRNPKKAATGDCDLKSLEKAKWCAKCDKVLEKDDIDKDGKCKKEGCGEKAKDIELCVKKCFSAKCHPDKELKAGGS